MGFAENIGILLRAKGERRLRYALISFMEAISMHLQVGFDLAYSWNEVCRAIEEELPVKLKEHLRPWREESTGVTSVLVKLSESYPNRSHRVWFSVLADLYRSGAPLAPACFSIAATLRKEHERELESHCHSLPTRMNVCLILFFLPPTLLLLFYPLVIEIIKLFNSA